MHTSLSKYLKSSKNYVADNKKWEKILSENFVLLCYIIQTEKKYNNYTITMFYFEDRSNFLIQRIIVRNLKLKK